MVLSVGVVGAGVVGLTTATMLQDQLPLGSHITVMADRFLRQTTSDGAAGIFTPGLQLQGPTEEITRQWVRDSYQHYSRLLDSPQAAAIGVKQISGYHFSNNYPKVVWNPKMESVVSEYRPCTAAELSLHGYKYGTFHTTLLTECRRYLPYLTQRFTSRGGNIVQRHLESLEDLAGHYDIVCNCSGFGAKNLVGDRSVAAIRGQVYKVKAPWLKTYYMVDTGTYIIPGIEHITVGGTMNFDSYDDQVNPHDSQSIWERCVKIVPSLKDGEVLTEWVGWLPYRPTIRVEKELMDFGRGKQLKVVHNYGHGGYGVLSSPGTSMCAVQLVQDLAQPTAKL